VANGNYTLRLHFVEPVMSGANQRVFSVAAEGRTIISNLDLHAEAGARTAVVKSFDLAVNDGTLNLRLFSTKDNAIISGIELVPQDSESPQFTEIQWSDRNAASPVTRSEALKGVVDGKLYVFGGFSGSAGPIVRSDVYDPKTNGWTRIADLPARITHVGVAVVGRDIYFAGAYTGLKATGYDQSFATRNVWKYNVDSNTFTSVTPLPEARGSGALVYTDGALHFFGGVDTSRRDRGEHWMMKLDGSNTWVAKAVNPDPRSHMGYAALDGKVYAIGGQHNTDANLTTRTTVQAYDPATNKWTDLAGMSRGISHIGSSTFAMGARLIVVGGEYAHLKGVADVQAYDPRANAWTQLTALPFTNNSTVADVIDGYIYNTTGSRQSMYVGKPVA
ncbi:MAG TPA: kelch repeat-containing protein, partial [Tepidisphaeraceae bacterium]|nr:kelch repeat-containing protein [Tepidisphaeraceae bacterium]